MSVDLSRWAGPCEAMFEHLAAEAPQELLDMIAGGTLHHCTLTFAAEWAGKVPEEHLESARRVLLPLLEHAQPIVREGAVYGLASNLNEDVVKRLKALAESDPSPGVRAAAESATDE